MTMLDKIKKFFKWLYAWITVIVALATTALSYGVDLVMSLPGDQLSIVMQPATALKITASAALLKAAIEAARSKMGTQP
jgi:hypothetical protein